MTRETSRKETLMDNYMVDFYGMRLDYRELPDYALDELVAKGAKINQKLAITEADYDKFYEAHDRMMSGDIKGAERVLLALIKKYDFYLAAYGLLWQVYETSGRKKEAKQYALKAYAIVQSRYPALPEDMTWTELEYRPALRVIATMASQYQYDGNNAEAIKLYKQLLKLTPNDNQGIRYLLAGLYAGVLPHVIDELTNEGNDLQDWSKLEDMVSEQNKLHHFWDEPDDE